MNHWRDTKLDRIGVDPAFTGDKEFDRPRATFKPDAAVDFVAGLIAAILTAVDAKVANVCSCEQTNPRTHLHVAAHSGIELPRIVNGGLHEHTANVGTRIKGGLAVS